MKKYPVLRLDLNAGNYRDSQKLKAVLNAQILALADFCNPPFVAMLEVIIFNSCGSLMWMYTSACKVYLKS